MNSLTRLDQTKASVLVFLSLAGLVCGMTLLFLGMRAVMEVGGACADGGPYVSVQPCPDGVPLAMVGGILGGVGCLFVYVWQTWSRGIASFVALAWPALFLSLGWNFLEFGLDPPGDGGLAWGWLICAVVFGAMGGVPLVLAAGPVARTILPFVPRQPESRMLRPPTTSWVTESAPASRGARANSVLPGPASDDLVDSLERLAQLHEEGALSDEEYAVAKRRLLEPHP